MKIERPEALQTVRTIRAAVIEATKAGEPNRWTYYVGNDRYGYRQRFFSRSDAFVMRDVASMRRHETTLNSRGMGSGIGMMYRATMADDTVPCQFIDRGTK